MPVPPQEPQGPPEAQNQFGQPDWERNGSHQWPARPQSPGAGGDPPVLRFEPVREYRLARDRKNVTVLVCICLVATLATISIVTIAVGAPPIALIASAGVLILNLASIVRYYFARRHRR